MFDRETQLRRQMGGITAAKNRLKQENKKLREQVDEKDARIAELESRLLELGIEVS